MVLAEEIKMYNIYWQNPKTMEFEIFEANVSIHRARAYMIVFGFRYREVIRNKFKLNNYF